jgi:hypothetical protein
MGQPKAEKAAESIRKTKQFQVSSCSGLKKPVMIQSGHLKRPLISGSLTIVETRQINDTCKFSLLAETEQFKFLAFPLSTAPFLLPICPCSFEHRKI